MSKPEIQPDKSEVLPWIYAAVKDLEDNGYIDYIDDDGTMFAASIIAAHAPKQPKIHYPDDGLNSAEYQRGWNDCAELGRIEAKKQEPSVPVSELQKIAEHQCCHCDYDEADGGLFCHCPACQEWIVKRLWEISHPTE